MSRLVEMTTSPTYAKEDWTPLTREARRWETGVSSVSSPPYSSGPGPRSSAKADDEYAVEAGYSRPQFARRPPADEERTPPVIKEHHVWGVVDEWGNRAGRWGKGAKAFYDENDSETKRDS